MFTVDYQGGNVSVKCFATEKKKFFLPVEKTPVKVIDPKSLGKAILTPRPLLLPQHHPGTSY